MLQHQEANDKAENDFAVPEVYGSEGEYFASNINPGVRFLGRSQEKRMVLTQEKLDVTVKNGLTFLVGEASLRLNLLNMFFKVSVKQGTTFLILFPAVGQFS